MKRLDKIEKRLNELSIIKHLDPKKLIRYKTTLKKNILKSLLFEKGYFVLLVSAYFLFKWLRKKNQ